MQRIRKDDVVQVLCGKDRGRTGRVLKLFPAEGKCLVEGVARVKKHQKATQTGGPAGIVEKSMKIDLSNVMPLDPKTKKPTRVRNVVDSDHKVRQSTSGSSLETALKN